MVLADPPYELADEAVTEMLTALVPALADGAAVVVERHIESPETAWPAGYVPTTQKLKKRTYGRARMDMAVFHADLAVDLAGAETGLPTSGDGADETGEAR